MIKRRISLELLICVSSETYSAICHWPIDKISLKIDCSLLIVQVAGLPTNIDFLLKLANHGAFRNGEVETHFIEQHKDDLFNDSCNPILAQEAYDAAKNAISILAACLCEKEHAALKGSVPGSFQISSFPYNLISSVNSLSNQWFFGRRPLPMVCSSSF